MTPHDSVQDSVHDSRVPPAGEAPPLASGTYTDALFHDVLPFWEQYSLDREVGGYFTCLTRDGRVFDTDKFIWLQARQVWMFSFLYRVVAQRPEWLQVAQLGAGFLLKHGRDENKDWYFSLRRNGRPLVAAYNIFSDCFATMALAEYAAAAAMYEHGGAAPAGPGREAAGGARPGPSSEQAREVALETYRRILPRRENPKGRFTKQVSGGRPLHAMALPMIGVNMAMVVQAALGNEAFSDIDIDPEQEITANVERVLDLHLDRAARRLFERVGPNGTHPDCMDGRLLNPGHACEVLWMIMEAGDHLGRRDWIDTATEALLWTVEHGWDRRYGGLYYYQDAQGFPPEKLEADMKLWWVHAEAIYAFAAAYEYTGSEEHKHWLERLHSYSWEHFADPEYGEWFGYLTREGLPSNGLKGGKWKGCFHLPRALLKTGARLQRLEKAGVLS